MFIGRVPALVLEIDPPSYRDLDGRAGAVDVEGGGNRTNSNPFATVTVPDVASFGNGIKTTPLPREYVAVNCCFRRW
jgi:hypothetical protein